MKFRVLGPLEVELDGRLLSINSARQRALLAVLLLHANQVVELGELVEAVWGGVVPAHPRAAVHTCVTRLRGTLNGALVIEAGADGYRVVVDEDDVDLTRFEAGLRSARATPEREVAVLREALELWRGEPLADVQSDHVRHTLVPKLVDRRLQALERLFELELAAGRYDVVLPDLQALAAENPLRERLWALLMMALYRVGRQADALVSYTEIRQRLVDELGVEPGAELRRAHQTVLAGGQEDEWRAECQLPIDIADFANRDAELDRLLELLRGDQGVPIAVISGPPGVGKSALMVRAAHRLMRDYPDGQWFLRLNGASSAPRSAADLLEQLLRTAGVDPTVIPSDVEARANLLRSRLADRRTLLVLDDAGAVDQVVPLLPGRPGCAVLVTSRSDLDGLSVLWGARRLSLQPLSDKHSYELLARIVGADRCAAEETATADLAALCGRLPLALRIAAANLASRPGLNVQRYAEDLRTGDRLAKLRTPGASGVAVQAAFDVSFAALSDADKRGFSLLGIVPGMDITAAAVAALYGCSLAEAEDTLDRLVAANLLERQDVDRFRFHDLIREYAADRARDYDTSVAFRRLADWYLHMVHAAVSRCLAALYMSPLGELPPDINPPAFTSDIEALRWLETERTNYLAIIRHAAVSSHPEYAWRLTDAARPDLHIGYYPAELAEAVSLGLSCARTAGDRRAEAMMLLARGGLKVITSRFDESVEDLARCRRIAVELNEKEIRATAVISLAGTYGAAGFSALALQHAQEALELVESDAGMADRRFEVLSYFGSALMESGQLARSIEILRDALAEAQTKSLTSRTLAHVYLGRVLVEMGHADEGLAQFHLALDQGSRHRGLRIECTLNTAAAYSAKGDLVLALESATTALETARLHNLRRNEARACAMVGTIHLSAGRPGVSLTHHQRAYELARELKAQAIEVEALAGMALAGSAVELADAAVELARKQGMRLMEAKALTALAKVWLGLGAVDEAREAAGRALAMHREFGCRPGEQQALAVLERCVKVD